MAEPERKAKPAGLSSKVMGLKFMQRAAEKQNMERAQAQAAQQAEKEEAQEELPPTAPAGNSDDLPSSISKGCTIIYDRQPMPQRMGTRMVFGGTPIPGPDAPPPPPPPTFQVPDQDARQQPQPVRSQAASEPIQRAVPAPPSRVQPGAGTGAGQAVTDLEMALTLGEQGNKAKAKPKARPADGAQQFTSLREQKKTQDRVKTICIVSDDGCMYKLALW
eukprot:CAMPEP_0119103230 /NCGR_PEP_ID=MMETSP1180-20130426/1722_1 /TAXON_ID=3052 ORGANISM="Chlamydomonas cf sp, Strain CCMP681" /NCGR_SAMPLE_ID=MMETSP1180 /ASSEMBLY_ACC=CAM_ASM_000741 /LENGTH=218 /DNA_ID=CAMNT_0007087681 /DNA_START=73 /DNA_END=726 /DNA_ORIENTATION=+